MKEEVNKIDPYYIAYNILLTALKNEDIRDGISKSLYMTKMCFNADNVILYKLNENGDYVHKYNQSLMKSNSSLTTSILNYTKATLKDNQATELKLDFMNLHNVAFIPVETNDEKYVIALTGDKDFENLNNTFVSTFINTMHTLLEKVELFERLMKSSEIDTLTGLSNRNAFEDYQNKTELTNGTVYVLFDLFRLKNINDNYSHAKGDEYIKKTADILKKYFPKYVYTVDSTGKKSRANTGSYLYRIGGDEFVLISNTESFQDTMLKIMIIQNEIQNLDLGINEILGINYGLVERKDNQTFRDLYLEADKLLSQNKKQTYETLGFERRR